MKIEAYGGGYSKSLAVMWVLLSLLKSCNYDSDPFQLVYNKASSCTSILAFKQIKVYDSVMHVGKKFQPVNVDLVGKIYVEHNYGWKTGFILELLLSIALKQ